MAVVSLAGLGGMVLSLFGLHGLRPDCDPTTRHLSELAVGNWGGLMVAAFLLAGISLLALSAGLWSSVAPSTSLRAACGLVALNGFANWAMAAFRTDLSIPGPGGVFEITTAGRIHDVLAAAHAGIWFVIPMLVVRAIRQDPRWHRMIRQATIAALAEMTAVGVVVSMQRSRPGLGQRLWIVVLIAWCALHALMIRRVASVRTACSAGR